MQKVFSKFDDLKEALTLAPVPISTDARGGEGPSKPWKLALEFTLQDEDLNSNDEVLC